MKYEFKLHPDFDTEQKLFGQKPAVILAIESEDPWDEGPVTARVVGIAESLEQAGELVQRDVDRITAMAQMDPPRRPRLLPCEYEMHVSLDGEYCCIGHQITIKWPDRYKLTGLPLVDGRVELT